MRHWLKKLFFRFKYLFPFLFFICIIFYNQTTNEVQKYNKRSIVTFFMPHKSAKNNKTNVLAPNTTTKSSKRRKISGSGNGSIYILWSRWRRGSSFLGKLLAYARSKTFYSYEPLHGMGLTVFSEGNPMTRYALHLLTEIINCEYNQHQALLNYFLETEFYFFYNPLTKRRCQPISSCNQTTLLSDLCNNAPLQVVKLLRLNLEFGKYFLEKNPKIKIIYLVRDPRGTLKSRSRLMWCLVTKDCHDPSSVCQVLQKEVDLSLYLHKTYPERFFFVRYEDLALNPKDVFKSLWIDLGEQFSSRIDRMIDKHTTIDLERGIYGLKKDSRRKVFSWRSSLDYKSMITIQKNCKAPMTKLGYQIFSTEEEYENITLSPLILNWQSSLSRYNAQDTYS